MPKVNVMQITNMIIRLLILHPIFVKDKLASAGHCTAAGRMIGIMLQMLFLPTEQGTILNSHRVRLKCALVAYLMIIADVGFNVMSYHVSKYISI